MNLRDFASDGGCSFSRPVLAVDHRCSLLLHSGVGPGKKCCCRCKLVGNYSAAWCWSFSRLYSGFTGPAIVAIDMRKRPANKDQWLGQLSALCMGKSLLLTATSSEAFKGLQLILSPKPDQACAFAVEKHLHKSTREPLEDIAGLSKAFVSNTVP